jgi:hypothetical protein
LAGTGGAKARCPRQRKLSTELDNDSIVPFGGSSLFFGPINNDFAAFVEATSIIRGHDVVEEFLACGL